LREFRANTPHVPFTAEPHGPAEPAGADGPAGAAGPTQWYDPGPEHFYSLEHNLDDCDSLEECRFDQTLNSRIALIIGSTYPIA
jgi:hypothetical protein